ncbi:MAG: hypothetical protein KA287_06475 [Rhodoferax sp.]|nr:hypothetical protein [Rhodoferax sp.]MBP7574353.1 hypothetical protein [Rhodoferax sp.]
MTPSVSVTAAPSRAQLVAALSVHGFRLRGSWLPGVDDALPALPRGQTAVVVWMVGVTGSGFWPFFKTSSFYQDGRPDPLDRWSHAIGSQLASQWGGVALFPFDGPPYHPFQQWAARAEPLQTSPLMLRIHPDFGLWHAYRFALALPAFVPDDLPSAALATANSDLCLSCIGQPCLNACPVQAFTGTAYKLETCATHLHAPDGADCMQSGCLARRACPVGRENTYMPEHAAFHMQAFTLKH